MKECKQCKMLVEDNESYCPRCGSGQFNRQQGNGGKQGQPNMQGSGGQRQQVNNMQGQPNMQGQQGNIQRNQGNIQRNQGNNQGNMQDNSARPQQAPAGMRNPNATVQQQHQPQAVPPRNSRQPVQPNYSVTDMEQQYNMPVNNFETSGDITFKDIFIFMLITSCVPVYGFIKLVMTALNKGKSAEKFGVLVEFARAQLIFALATGILWSVVIFGLGSVIGEVFSMLF